jgi:acetyl-CoA carboxylase carboxyl transferase subunit beta
MSISDWFKAREARRYVGASAPAHTSDLPDGVWLKCEECKRTVYQGDLEKNLQVCPGCGKHTDLTAADRIAYLVDDGSFAETDAGVGSRDPLSFTSGKPYAGVLETAREKTGMREAVVTGRATIGGHAVVVGAMDFRFVGASMGSAVGEKITRAFELALAEKRPLVLAIASGGARMQEGMLSLMQMAKTAAAAARLSEARVPYIALLTNPTMGGVTASFATLADIIYAEPSARIGFAGPRLVEQTIRAGLPKHFQTAESLLVHGMVDDVVDRRDLTDRVALTLRYLEGGE